MIYFIEAVGLDRVKVGTSVDPKDRLSKLTCAMPCEVRLLKVIPGGVREEHALHRKWNEHRIKGEWFVLSAIRGEIDALTDASEAVEKYRTCQRCGSVRQSKDGRYRGLFCRACGVKEAGERRRKESERANKERCVCVDCMGKVSAKSIYYAHDGKTHDGALRCRPCAMKRAWSDPCYRDSIMRSRKARRKLCLSCGKDGVSRRASYHPMCWKFEQAKRAKEKQLVLA